MSHTNSSNLEDQRKVNTLDNRTEISTWNVFSNRKRKLGEHVSAVFSTSLRFTTSIPRNISMICDLTFHFLPESHVCDNCSNNWPNFPWVSAAASVPQVSGPSPWRRAAPAPPSATPAAPRAAPRSRGCSATPPATAAPSAPICCSESMNTNNENWADDVSPFMDSVLPSERKSCNTPFSTSRNINFEIRFQV